MDYEKLINIFPRKKIFAGMKSLNFGEGKLFFRDREQPIAFRESGNFARNFLLYLFSFDPNLPYLFKVTGKFSLPLPIFRAVELVLKIFETLQLPDFVSKSVQE